MGKGLKLLAIPFAILTTATIAPATEFHLYFLGGQSNMEGYGRVENLPAAIGATQHEVLIFHGNPSPDGSPAGGVGLWSKLKPGHGYRFRSNGNDNKYSDRFGIELTFARQIAKRFPERRIAILKYANSGTSLDPAAAGDFGCWDPSPLIPTGLAWIQGRTNANRALRQTNQFDNFLKALQQAQADEDIDGDGEPDKLIPTGIAWIQGESDANHGREIANRYRSNLNRLLRELRMALGDDDLHIALGRVSPSQLPDVFWKHLNLIRAAQTDFAREDNNTTLITSSDTYGFSDAWHYNAEGYLELGREFGDALADLELRGIENNESP